MGLEIALMVVMRLDVVSYHDGPSYSHLLHTACNRKQVNRILHLLSDLSTSAAVEHSSGNVSHFFLAYCVQNSVLFTSIRFVLVDSEE